MTGAGCYDNRIPYPLHELLRTFTATVFIAHDVSGNREEPCRSHVGRVGVPLPNWGSVYIDFDCDAEGRSARRVAAGYPDPSCRVLTNAKYNTVRNFTHHIHPGDWSVPTDSEATTAFLRGDGTGATLVHVNQSDEAQQVTLDLSLFGQVDAGATVTPVVTTAPTAEDLEANALVEGAPVAVDAASRTATLEIPAKSVTTLLVDGVTGVAEDAVPADGEGLLLEGVGSRLLLTADADGATIEPLADDAAAATGQRWELRTLSGEGTNRRTVVLTDAAGGVLAAGADHTVAVIDSDPETAAATPEQQWVLSTLDGRTWSLLNVATTEQLDVAGEGTTAGTGVGTWTSSTGAHQRWTFRSTELRSVAPVQVATPVGVAPELPATVVPTYAWGAGTPVPVTWQVPDASSWAQPGAVTVTGTGTDVFGTPFEATAVVDVGDHTLTDPVSVSTYVGADLASVVAQAPDVVPAHVGTSPRTYDLPVTWDWSSLDASATATVGVVRVEGTATAPSGPLPASLAVVVTEPTPANAAPLPTTTASATFTEPGYDVDGTRNGDTTDKAWSNWRSGPLRASDTLTYDLGAPADVSGATVHFYRDGSHASWARTVLAEYRAADGSWVAVPGGPQEVTVPQGGAPTAEIDLGGVRTDAVRFVLDPSLRDGAPVHMTVAEVEIDVLVASPSAVADLAALRVGGVPVTGFDPARDAYTVQVPEGAGTEVTAIALDRQATVTVAPGSGGPGTGATVTVTSPDGSTTRTVTVTVVQPEVSLVSLGGVLEDGDRLVRPGVVVATVQGSVPGSQLTVELDGRVLGRGVVHRGGVGLVLAYVPLRTATGTHTLILSADGVPLETVEVTVTGWFSGR